MARIDSANESCFVFITPRPQTQTSVQLIWTYDANQMMRTFGKDALKSFKKRSLIFAGISGSTVEPLKIKYMTNAANIVEFLELHSLAIHQPDLRVCFQLTLTEYDQPGSSASSAQLPHRLHGMRLSWRNDQNQITATHFGLSL